jgi:hypothetical protein
MNLDVSPANHGLPLGDATTAWRFDHVNVSMGSNHALSRLFEGVMGLTVGPRPPFPFPGQWLYAGDQAVVHAVNDTRLSAETGALRFGHIAFSSEIPASQLIERLRQSALPFKVARVPQDRIAQIFVLLRDDLVVELGVPDDLVTAADHHYSETQAAPGAGSF